MSERFIACDETRSIQGLLSHVSDLRNASLIRQQHAVADRVDVREQQLPWRP